jgi:zinc protease
MLKAVQKYVEDAKPGRVFEHNVAEEPPVLAPRTLVATFPKIGQAKLELSFPSVKLTNADMYALDLLASALGSGESSVLTEEIRDKKQLVSSISAGDETPTYATGSFSIYMQLDPKKIDEATKSILEVIEKTKADGIDDERLQSAKTQIKVNHVRGLETTEGVATELAVDQMNTGDLHFTDRYVDRISKVTNEQIKDVASRYLNRGRLITTVMLPREFVGAGNLTKAEDLIRPVAPTTRPGEMAAKSEVTRMELSNGTIVLLKRMTAAPIVSMNMYALGGLTLEDEKSNGIGNLTMRMLMRGTKTRSAQQIAEFFDSIGAEMGTACGNNSWYWTGSCLKEDFAKVLEVYADVVNNPSFAESEISQMKPRIEAAIDGQDADWHSQAFRYFKKMYYGPRNEPYQFTIQGPKENVAAFTQGQMKDWYEQKVLPARRVLAIYGDIDVDQAAKLAEQYLGSGVKVAGQAPVNKAPQPTPPSDAKPCENVQRVEVQETQQKLAGIVIGFNADTVVGDDNNNPIMVGQTMASGYGYPTGYLFEILRGRGLVYEVAASNQPGQSEKLPGTFMAYAGCEPSKVNEVVETMLENIARLQGTPEDVQPDWYERSKKLLLTNEALENETPGQQASINALDELFGMGYRYHDSFEQRINAVTLDQVRQVARDRLSSCVVTISTPTPQDVQVKKGLRTYDKFPTVDLTPRGIQHDTGGKQ